MGSAGDGDDDDDDNNVEREGGSDVEEDVRVEKPRMYKVIFHNDDYTTMEFVSLVLMRFFHKNEAEAQHIMLTVHTKGAATAGIYPRDIAESKVAATMDHARDHGMPLMLSTEPE